MTSRVKMQQKCNRPVVWKWWHADQEEGRGAAKKDPLRFLFLLLNSLPEQRHFYNAYLKDSNQIYLGTFRSSRVIFHSNNRSPRPSHLSHWDPQHFQRKTETVPKCNHTNSRGNNRWDGSGKIFFYYTRLGKTSLVTPVWKNLNC